MRLTLFAGLALLSTFAAAAETKFSDEQLKALFAGDLGPAEIDVSAYPKAQQENYKVFAKTCSQCHTVARPINSNIVKRADWKRYVARMHLKTMNKVGTVILKKDAAVIVDFLAFDSNERKIKGKDAFEAKQKELAALFEDVKKEQVRRRTEESKEKGADRGRAPYTGTK